MTGRADPGLSSASGRRAPGVPPRALLGEGLRRLQAAGLPAARAEAELLLAGVCGIARARLYVDLSPVDGERIRAYRAALDRRVAGEPVQYLLGREGFGGLEVRVTPAVLIPRRETELLAEWALARLPVAAISRESARRMVADVGTGSGCLAVVLAVHRPDARVIAVDSSPAALAVAADNVRLHRVEDRVRLVAADLLEPVAPSTLDLVVANPPYIPTSVLPTLPLEVRDWEPRGALDGGSDGMDVHRRLIASAAAALRPGGTLVMEMGEGQAEALTARMEAAGFIDVVVRRDLGGIERYIGGRVRPPALGGR